MNIFDVLGLIGGLCLFLFGMNIMGDALERTAGGKLELLLGKLTKNKFKAFLTGLGVTAVIQSSSATTVMVVGFVNSGIMTLRQSIGVIMGANIGTTVTAWILSLGGISGDNIFVQLLKPSSFTPILALIGIILFMLSKSGKRKDAGTILLGFATLMFGMEAMSSSVAGLAEVEWFRNLFVLFSNPILGVLVGAFVTAVIQSSSASVGILQALTVTGQVSYGAAVPIIMGQNIGTCVTALISSIGANRNAKRAAALHLSFNIIGTTVWLAVFSIISAVFKPLILKSPASYLGIAVIHSIFNVLCTLLLLPMSSLLEKLVLKLVPDAKKAESNVALDERLLATPTVALERATATVNEMARDSADIYSKSVSILFSPNDKIREEIKTAEAKTDNNEDLLGTYLIKLSQREVSERDSATVSKLLKIMSDFERIADHSVNLVEAADELEQKNIVFSSSARRELTIMTDAVSEIIGLTTRAFLENDVDALRRVEPLEEVIDLLKYHLRNHHILRLKGGDCSVEAGFIWADIIIDLERIADHCSNIAVCIVDASNNNMNLHRSTQELRSADGFDALYAEYSEKYSINKQ